MLRVISLRMIIILTFVILYGYYDSERTFISQNVTYRAEPIFLPIIKEERILFAELQDIYEISLGFIFRHPSDDLVYSISAKGSANINGANVAFSSPCEIMTTTYDDPRLEEHAPSHRRGACRINIERYWYYGPFGFDPLSSIEVDIELDEFTVTSRRAPMRIIAWINEAARLVAYPFGRIDADE